MPHFKQGISTTPKSRGATEMTVRVAINGFGRIGRNVLRAIAESGRKDIEVVAHQRSRPGRDQRPPAALRQRARPLPRRSHRRGRHDRSSATAPIKVTAIKDPAQLPRKELGVDIALECTGIFTAEGQGRGAPDRRRQARAGLGAGRRRRPDGRLRRQPRQADQGPHSRLQRLLHHQLPRAGRQGAERRRRHRARAS